MPSLAKTVGPLDARSNLPLYQQLQRALKLAIDQHILAPDDALPAERDLATEFDVSRITVRKALEGLVAEGLLVRRQGSGNFVSARVEKNFAMLTSFSEDMRARPQPAHRVAEAFRRDGNAGGSAGAAPESRHAGLSIPSTALRR